MYESAISGRICKIAYREKLKYVEQQHLTICYILGFTILHWCLWGLHLLFPNLSQLGPL